MHDREISILNLATILEVVHISFRDSERQYLCQQASKIRVSWERGVLWWSDVDNAKTGVVLEQKNHEKWAQHTCIHNPTIRTNFPSISYGRCPHLRIFRSIVVSMWACQAWTSVRFARDPGSIPGGRDLSFALFCICFCTMSFRRCHLFHFLLLVLFILFLGFAFSSFVSLFEPPSSSGRRI